MANDIDYSEITGANKKWKLISKIVIGVVIVAGVIAVMNKPSTSSTSSNSSGYHQGY